MVIDEVQHIVVTVVSVAISGTEIYKVPEAPAVVYVKFMTAYAKSACFLAAAETAEPKLKFV